MYSNEDYLLPCINALLYIGLLVFAIKSKHGILIMISVIWLVCALFGILYSMVPFTLTSYDITIEPYIYMFILFLIGLFPISRLRMLEKDKLIVVYNKNIVNYIVFVLAISSFIPFLESIIQIVTSGVGNLASNYEERLDDFDTRGYFSFIGRLLYSIDEYFEFLTPMFLFVYLTSELEKKKWIIIGLCIASVNPMLNNLANGQRFYVVTFLYMMLFNFLLFRKLLDERIKKTIYLLSILAGGGVGILFVAISVTRTGNGTEELGALYQVVRYMGESMYNFNTDCYWINDYLYGEHSLKGFFTYFNIGDMSIDDQTSFLGIMSNVFYTYIGAFVMDFGLISTMIILTLLSFICLKLIVSIDNEINLGFLIIISLYANVLMFGTTYFVYENGFIHLVWSIVLAIFFINANVVDDENAETV